MRQTVTMIHTATNSMRHTAACLICGKVHACVRTGRLDLGQRQHVHRGGHYAEELGHRGLGYGRGEDAHGSYHEVGERSVCSEGGGLVLVGGRLVFREILNPELVMERLTCRKDLLIRPFGESWYPPVHLEGRSERPVWPWWWCASEVRADKLREGVFSTLEARCTLLAGGLRILSPLVGQPFGRVVQGERGCQCPNCAYDKGIHHRRSIRWGADL